MSIGDWAFRDCSSLTSITIPNSVTSIGCKAFYGCSSLPVENSLRYADTYLLGAVDKTLSTYSIKEGTKWIGDHAFSDCSSLTSMVVAEGNRVYDSREQCNAIIRTATNKLIRGCQNTIIPDGVTSLGDEAFECCPSLTSIVIPESVTSLGESAFSNCKSLTSIAFNGTKAQWEGIKLGIFWMSNVPARVVHCTDGEVKI